MTSHPLDVTATLRLGSAPTLTLRSLGGTNSISAPISNTATFNDLRAQLPIRLEEFKQKVMAGRDPSTGIIAYSAVSGALMHLHTVGSAMLHELLGDEAKAICNYMAATWAPLRAGEVALPRLIIDIDETAVLPLEIMPIVDFRAAGQVVNDLSSMLAALRGYPAFCARVSRRPKVKIANSTVTDAVFGTIPARLTFLRHENLSGATRELKHLQKLRAAVSVENELPVQNTVKGDLADILFDDCSDILHFSCHSRAGDELANEIVLEIQGEGRRITLSQRDFHGWMTNRLMNDQSTQFGKLVFVNACKSAGATLMSGSSFPRLFLKQDASHVIATETAVPDAVAYLMSINIYDSLAKNMPVDEAVYRARIALLKGFSNPLGCLYSVFQQPDQDYL